MVNPLKYVTIVRYSTSLLTPPSVERFSLTYAPLRSAGTGAQLGKCAFVPW